MKFLQIQFGHYDITTSQFNVITNFVPFLFFYVYVSMYIWAVYVILKARCGRPKSPESGMKKIDRNDLIFCAADQFQSSRIPGGPIVGWPLAGGKSMEYRNRRVLAPMVRVVSCETLKPIIDLISVFSVIYNHIKVDHS